MKTNLFFVCLACFLVSKIETRHSKPKDKPQKVQKVPSAYYIQNWFQYKMPEQIETEKLKAIMEHIAGFKRLEFCPYGRLSRCHKLSLQMIVQKIIENALNDKLYSLEDSTEETTEKKTSKITALAEPSQKGLANVNAVAADTELDHESEEAAAADHDADDPGAAHTEDAVVEADPDADDAGATNPEETDAAAHEEEAAPEAEATDTETEEPEAAERKGARALRAQEKQHVHRHPSDLRNYPNGNMINLVKMVNLGNNVQYFNDNKGHKKRNRDTNQKYDKHNVLNLLDKIVKLYNPKGHENSQESAED